MIPVPIIHWVDMKHTGVVVLWFPLPKRPNSPRLETLIYRMVDGDPSRLEVVERPPTKFGPRATRSAS